MTTPAEVLNPVDIETAIQECNRQIYEGVKIVTRAEKAAKKARRDYDHAFAIAYMRHDGPQSEKRYAAEIATYNERATAEDAEIAFRHAERQAKAVDKELSGLQSIGSSVRTMYGATR